MSVFLNKIANDDFLWNVLVQHLPSFNRSATEFMNFRCPVCVDYKARCGIKRSTRIGINCYNCSFVAGYSVGKGISKNMTIFLERIGVTSDEIVRIKHQAFVIRRILQDSDHVPEAIQAITFEPNFPKMSLPQGSMTLMEWADHGCTDADYIQTVEYAMSRGDILLNAIDYHWSPEAKFSKRLIIPFRWRDKIVGYTARAIDDNSEKYLNFMPSDFLVNNRVMDIHEREFVILVEGPTDAFAIDGVSPCGAKLNEKQTVWLKSSGKKIIVVPDRDEQGQAMINIAIKNKWHVAFPGLRSHHSSWWDDDIKDCDAAIKRHGRLYTLKSILETATTNATEIEVKRQYLV